MRMAGVVVAITLSAIGGRAAADVRMGVRPELRLGAGWDDNLFVGAREAGPPQIRSDVIFDVAPRLAGWLGAGGHLLSLSADYLERVTLSTGELRDLVLRAGYATPLFGPVTLAAGAIYEHYQPTLFSDSAFDLGGGELEVAVFAGARVRLSAGWRGAARYYAEQLDNDQRAFVRLRATPIHWLTLEGDYNFVAVRSNDPSAQLDRHGGEIGVALRPTAWLQLSARYGLAVQELPEGRPQGARFNQRTDLRQSFVAIATAQPLRWLALYARYELLDSTSTDRGGSFHRNLFVGGVSVAWDLERRFARPPPFAPTVRDGRVTFRHRAKTGRRVSVIGDWNAWNPSASPLVEVAPGRYEAAYMVPQGRREYAFTVDGAVEAPIDAPAYTPDGFGGKNGVLDIP